MNLQLFKTVVLILLGVFFLSETYAQPASKQRKENPTTADKMLLQAADKADIAAAKKALDAGAFVDTQDAHGTTPLQSASLRLNDDLIKLLLERGADPAIQNDDGFNAADEYNYANLITGSPGSGAEMFKILNEKAEVSAKKAQDLIDAIVANDAAKALGLIRQGAYIDYRDKRLETEPTPLIAASYNGNIRVVEALFNAGVRVNKCDKEDVCALTYAVSQSHPYIARLLIEHGADVNRVSSKDGGTPLLFASQAGNADLVRMLLERKAKVNLVAKESKGSALHFALAAKHPEIIPILLAAKADPNLQSFDGTTPLMLAAENGDSASVKLLLDSGADPKLRSANGKTALDIAKERNNQAVTDVLNRSAVSASATNETTKPLTVANVLTPDVLGSLIAPDPKPNKSKPATAATPPAQEEPKATPSPSTTANSTGPKNNDPAKIAEMFKTIADWDTDHIGNSVRLIDLLRGGVDPNVQDGSGRTPLVYAAALKVEPYAALLWLLKSGADINAQSSEEGTTPLMEAILRKNPSSVLQLLSAGPRIDVKDKKGRTAYDIALEVNDPLLLTFTGMLKPNAVWFVTQAPPADKAKHNKPDQIAVLFKMIVYRKEKANRGSDVMNLLQDLLKLGVNPDARDGNGLTPLMLAAAYGDDAAVNILMSDGADINAQSAKEGMTPLMGAALKGEFGALGTLLLYKPRLDIKDKKGRTAYDCAVENGGVVFTLYGPKLRPE